MPNPFELLREQDDKQAASKPGAIAQPVSTQPEVQQRSVEGSGTWVRKLSLMMQRFYEAADQGQAFDVRLFQQQVSGLVHVLMQHPKAMSVFELQMSNQLEYLAEHPHDLSDLLEKAMILFLYSLKIGMRIQLEAKAMLSLITVASLHAIGMAVLPSSIRKKNQALSAEERAMIQHAPTLAVQYLQACGLSDETALQAIAQIQERFDGSGPLGLCGNQLHVYVRIIAPLTMLQALTHYRSYRKRLLPRDAIRVLIKEHKEQFDPVYLKALIESVSLYPVGIYVQLNSGDIAQVVEVSQRLPMRPKVRVYFDRDGNKVVQRTLDLQAYPHLRVQCCMYKEQIPHDTEAF